MAKKKIAARSDVNTVRVRALTAEGFSCEDCLYLDTPWQQGRSRTEKSCRARGFGTKLCNDFTVARSHAVCGHCQYLNEPDPEDGIACAPEYDRKATDLTCDKFSAKYTDIETDDLVLVHAGRVVDGVKYSDTPQTPIAVRIGDVGLILEPVLRRNGVSFNVIPFALDDEGDLIVESNSDASVAKPCGAFSVNGELYKNVTVKVTPRAPSYKKRIRRADVTEIPHSVKRILKASVSSLEEAELPDILKNRFFQLREENVAPSMAARLSVRWYSKTNDVEDTEAEKWRKTLIKLSLDKLHGKR